MEIEVRDRGILELAAFCNPFGPSNCALGSPGRCRQYSAFYAPVGRWSDFETAPGDLVGLGVLLAVLLLGVLFWQTD